MPKLWSESSEICKDWCWCYSWDCILHYEKTCHHRFFFFKIKINLLEYWNTYMHIAQKSFSLFWFKKLQQVIFLFPGEKIIFSKFYGKVGVISWFLFHLIWKNYVLYWDFDLKGWIVDFFTPREKTPQNNFSSQNFSEENGE